MLAWRREADGERRIVVVAFEGNEEPFAADAFAGYRVSVASDGLGEGEGLPALLPADRGFWLEPDPDA